MHHGKYSTNEIVKLFNISKETIIKIANEHKIQYETNSRGWRLFTLEQAQTIIALKKCTPSLKCKNRSTQIRAFIEAHPAAEKGIQTSEVCKALNITPTLFNSLKYNVSTDFPIYIKDKKIYLLKREPKMTKEQITEKRKELISLFTPDSRTFTRKELCKKLRVTNEELTRIIATLKEIDNIECVSTDTGIVYRYIGF